tara:strand:- start:66 stop:284 length:219 start_codon:yes stop_codon:yes gene_type:complete
MHSVWKLIWEAKLDRDCLPLLVIFGLLLGICFGGVSVDIINPESGLNSLLCFFSGFLFGQLVSVLTVKAIIL